jgi:uncharacterized protein (TIGR03083 family)
MAEPWVEQIARQLSEDRRQVIDFVRGAAPEFWSQPSVVDGWTNKHILAHLAGGNDQFLQLALRSVVLGERVEPGVFAVDTDEENARRIEERLSWDIARLAAELERDGAEVRDLLVRVRDEDTGARQPGLAMTLGDFLRIVGRERHDQLHLEQLHRSTVGI